MSLVRFSARNHPQQRPNPEVDDRATTPEMFAEMHARFRFSIDVAASAHNAKLARYYSIVEDGLERSWAGERVWCNPPFSNIEAWVEKAWSEWVADGENVPEVIVMLLPANRTEQGWWHRWVEPNLHSARGDFRCEFLPGRIRFIRRGATGIGPNERPPFGCCLLIWERQVVA